MNNKFGAPCDPAIAPVPLGLSPCSAAPGLSYTLASECELARANASTLLLLGRIDVFSCYELQAAARGRQAEIEALARGLRA